nr:L-ribulose-5-phosphate 4-epimerase [uncultured Anaerostipes sp.]
MLEELKKRVLEANLLLPAYGLITFTWGNVSEIDREKGVVAIKPSGVEYDKMKQDDIVLVDLEGNILEGNLKPSSDLETHLEFYRNWPNIGGVVHTHSTWATSFAQAGQDIIALGTTQADYFHGAVPCTRHMTPEEIRGDYELETGKVIVEELRRRGIDPDSVPGVLVQSHGPFTWGSDGSNAVHNAVVLEECAKMNAIAILVKNSTIQPMQQELLDKHFNRKHGPEAYYGQ